MITGQRLFLALSICAVVVLLAFAVVADETTGAQSPEEIIRQLTPRGLPHMGTTAPAGPNPAISPANVPSAAPAPASSQPYRVSVIRSAATVPRVVLRRREIAVIGSFTGNRFSVMGREEVPMTLRRHIDGVAGQLTGRWRM